MKLAGLTDVGRVRANNQDRFCFAKLSAKESFALVCDGMGGAAGGATAASIACDVMGKTLMNAPKDCPLGSEKPFLQMAAEAANTEVFTQASENAELAGMGTTTVCAFVRDDQVFISHAGDSRGYLLRAGALEQLTHDHSYVQGLVDCGTITLQEAETHPNRNAITRAVGVEYRIETEFTSASIVADDVLMLCTDGLTRSLSVHEMETIFRKCSEEDVPFEEIPERLVAAANEAGGTDNITVVLLGVEAKERNNG